MFASVFLTFELNFRINDFDSDPFDHYKKLHYSQTCVFIIRLGGLFDHYKKLHYSQTEVFHVQDCYMFDHYKKLHYSQTSL